MAAIYQNAYLSIAATRSTGSNHGLFSTIASICDPRTILIEHSSPVYFRKSLPYPSWHSITAQSEKAEFPLLTRAWVYQECLTSRRTVHFAANELFWESFEDSWCECTPPQAKDYTPYHLKADYFLLLTTKGRDVNARWQDSRRVLGPRPFL